MSQAHETRRADEDQQDEVKAQRRARRLDETRLLDPWERYRALCDGYDAQFEVTELADRKTRFALVMLGALNALNLFAATRLGSLDRVFIGAVPVMSGYFGLYAVLSVVIFFQAIQALRPRMGMVPGSTGQLPGPAGLRFVPDIISSSADHYYGRWTRAEIGEINREVATHVHVLARVNDIKFVALDRLFRGLVALAALTAILVTVVAAISLGR
jgi:hypothetical protein